MTALTRPWSPVCGTRLGCVLGIHSAIGRNAEMPGGAVRIGWIDRLRCTAAAAEGVASIAWQNRNIVVLLWVQMDLTRINRYLLLCFGPALATSYVANPRHMPPLVRSGGRAIRM